MTTTRSAPAAPRPVLSSRAVHAAGVAVLAIVLLAGCRTDNTPTSYNDQVQASFVQTCTGNVPVDGTTIAISSNTYCQCAYTTFYNLVPYNKDDQTNRDNGNAFKNYSGKVFTDIENDLKDDPGKFNDNTVVPQNVRDTLQQNCHQVAEGTSIPGTVVSPGTTVASSTGTTPGTNLK